LDTFLRKMRRKTYTPRSFTMARRNALHEPIQSKRAPKPIGPYVQAIKVKRPGEMLYVSGQIPIELPSGRVFTGDIKKQAELCLSHLRSIIQDAKFSMDEVVKVTIFLTDMKNFEVVNQVYQEFFVGQSVPARAVVQVAALPKEVGVEIEAVVIKAAASVDDILADEEA
jgi:2-iminobutanoate/2-iminopropanoate deaminase